MALCLTYLLTLCQVYVTDIFFYHEVLKSVENFFLSQRTYMVIFLETMYQARCVVRFIAVPPAGMLLAPTQL